MLSRDALRLLDQMRTAIGVRAVGGKLQAPAAEHVALIQRAMLAIVGSTCATTR